MRYALVHFLKADSIESKENPLARLPSVRKQFLAGMQSMVYEIPTSHIGSDKINIDFLINLKSYIYRRKYSITIFVEAYYAKFEIGRVVA